MQRRTWVALATLAASLASTVAFAQAKDLKVAHIYSRTGPLEAYGKQTQTGLMMGHLTILKVRKKEGQFTFLSEEDDRRLKSDEAKLWFSFKKVTDAKKADH